MVSDSLNMYRWRGYFSSIRPAPGKLILNLNTTVQPYFLPGNLPALCAALLGLKDPYQLGNLSPKRVIPLNRFLKNLDIKVTERVDGRVHRFKIREFSEMPADVRTFDLDGRSITVKVCLVILFTDRISNEVVWYRITLPPRTFPYNIPGWVVSELLVMLGILWNWPKC